MREDLKSTFQEVGLSYVIVRDSGDVSGEYLTYESNAQVTKPFIREFFLEAELAYDTQVVNGDYLYLTTSDDYYMVMNKTPEVFEDQIISFNAVLYKCNVIFELLRPSESDNSDYNLITTWSSVKVSRGLLTSPLHGVDSEEIQEIGLIQEVENEFYVPSSIGIQELDRIKISSDEYYSVDRIKKRRFAAVDVVELGEDTRPFVTTTTTTTTTTTSSTSTSTTTTTA
jgi:hypothetical protein